MNRRWLLRSVSGLVALPASAKAQPARPPMKIGYLHPRTIAEGHPTLQLLRSQWQAMGYVQGDTVLLRSASDDDSRLPMMVRELIDAGVGVLIVVGAAAVRAASLTTRTVPIVAIDLETDPVHAGYAASFARPGGNVTGLFLDQPALAGKWIDLLREAAPDVRRIVLLWDRSTGIDQLEIARAVARTKGLDTVVLELGKVASFDEALRGLTVRLGTGIIPMSSPGFVLVAPVLAVAALKYRLPTIGFLKVYARNGMLMSYGPIQEVYFPRAVMLADKILHGARPSEMPIEGPDRFELVLNLKTAKALGLTIPQSLLLQADEVLA